MASKTPFPSAELYIRSAFDNLIQKLTARRDQLLAELNELKNSYDTNEKTRTQTLQFLQEMMEQAEALSLMAGTAKEMLIANRPQMDRLKQPTPLPVPQFDNRRLLELEELIDTFGSVQDATVIHSDKLQPFKSIGKKGKGDLELDGPRGIATDKKGNLYIADGRNRRIQVISLDGTYVTEFGNEELASPHGVAIGKKCVVVSDKIHHSVLKYETCNYELVSRCDDILKLPLGLCVDGNEVFVADSKNNRVAVLNLELNFELIREFGNKKLIQPVDVKTGNNNVYVADNGVNNHIHIFSKSGYQNTSLIKLNPDIGPLYMCIGNYNNIIVSDYLSKKIKIFTPEGEVLHSIETDYEPTGIVVNESNTILCANFANNCINWY